MSQNGLVGLMDNLSTALSRHKVSEFFKVLLAFTSHEIFNVPGRPVPGRMPSPEKSRQHPLACLVTMGGDRLSLSSWQKGCSARFDLIEGDEGRVHRAGERICPATKLKRP